MGGYGRQGHCTAKWVIPIVVDFLKFRSRVSSRRRVLLTDQQRIKVGIATDNQSLWRINRTH